MLVGKIKTKKQLKVILQKIAKIENVKSLRFRSAIDKQYNIDGMYNGITKTITISQSLPIRTTLLTFFHELGHHVAVENGLWHRYHRGDDKFSAEYAFLIENSIDKIARMLWRKYVDTELHKRYVFTYTKARKAYFVAFFRDYFNIEEDYIEKDVLNKLLTLK